LPDEALLSRALDLRGEDGYAVPMHRTSLAGRTHVLVAVIVLGLGLSGVALAHLSATATAVRVTLLDGKLTVSPKTFASGKLDLIVVNKGKLTHGLAIMGLGLDATRTPTIPEGKTVHLAVSVKVGMYHVWDPVRSSMTHATMLMATSSAAGGNSAKIGSGGAAYAPPNATPATTGSGSSMSMDDCEHM